MVLLMGSKEEVPEKPKEQVKFIEDMDEEEIATIVSNLRLELPYLPVSLKHITHIHPPLVDGNARWS